MLFYPIIVKASDETGEQSMSTLSGKQALAGKNLLRASLLLLSVQAIIAVIAFFVKRKTK